MKRNIAILLFAVASLSSCVSKKKFQEMQYGRETAEKEAQQLKVRLENCDKLSASLQSDLDAKNKDLDAKGKELAAAAAKEAALKDEKSKLSEQLDYFKKTNTNLLDRLSDLSVVSKTSAESIKKSLDAINEQSGYIKDLNNSIRAKDSLNLALVMNLKRSLADINDQDVQVEVKKGVVYVSLSDKMLFKSGSSEINASAESVMGKIAKILNDYKDFDLLVEGHTDNVPISTAGIVDNWDLSAKRATSVVRMLQKKFGVQPNRMTAGGRSEYVPKGENTTAAGRQANRRTEIVILPKLDQFFQLLEPKK